MSKQSHSSLRNVLDQLRRRRCHGRDRAALAPEALEPRLLLYVGISKVNDEVVGVTEAAVSVNYGLSSSDPEAFIGGVWVDWGDGPAGSPDTSEVFSSGVTMTHMYSKPGSYTVNAYEVESGTYWTSSDTYTDSTDVYAIPVITPKPILGDSDTGPTGAPGATPSDPPATDATCPTTDGVDPEPAVNAPIPGVTSTGFDPEFNDVFDFQQEYTTEPDIPVGFLGGGGDQLTPDGQPIIPYLTGAYDPNTDGFMYGVVSGANVYWFQSSGSEYYLGWQPDNTFTEMYDYGWTLQYPSTSSPESPAAGFITVKEVSGLQLVFNPIFTPDDWGPGGSLYEAIAPNGDTLTPSYGSSGLSAVTMTTSDGTTETDQNFSLSYSDGYISDVLLQRRSYAVGGTVPDYTNVQQAAYTYYDGSTSYGALGQLQTVTIEDGSGNPEETSYYRYYNTDGIGYDSLLELYLSGPSYAQASAALPSGTTPLTASLTQLQPYADRYYTYDGTDVNTMVAQGEGCSSCSGGEGTYTYSYSYNTSGGAGVYNTWWLKTTITLPDETQQVDYYDQYGLEMLQVTSDGTHMQGWFTEYDDQGRVMLIAEPSAVNLPSDLSTLDANPDLLNKVDGSYEYLNNSVGQIETINYYSSYTATSTTAGSVPGYMSDWYLQEGQNGTPIHEENLTYYDFSYGDPWVHVYPIGADTVYGNTDGTDDTRTTSYVYSTYSGTSRIESMETTYPTISSGQNGPGSSDVVDTFYDTYGLPIWTQDANGNVSYTAYDVGTGAVIETITDVKYSDLTSAEQSSFDLTGWTEPTSGLNLVTTYQVDGLGRTTEETDPDGNVTYTVYNDATQDVRVYPGWHEVGSTWTTTGPIQISDDQLWGTLLSGQATTGGTTTTLIDTTNLSTSEDYVGYTLIVTGGTDAGQTAVVTGYDPSTQTLTFSAGLTAATDSTTQYTLNALYTQTLTSSATPTVNGDNQPTGEETFSASNVQSLSRDLTNAAGQTIEADNYFSLAGTTYSTSAAQLGSASNNSASGNYHPTLYSYDALGRQDKVVSPTGTITRTIYDWLGRVSSVWVGTDDTPSSGYWSPTNNTSPSNMIDVEDYYYDQRPTGPAAPTLGETSGGSLAAATYYVVITYVTPNDESVASTESSYSVSADNLLTVASPAVASGATGYNVYVSTSGGQEQLQNSTPIAIGTGWTESTSGLVAGANAQTATNAVGDSDLTETVEHPDTTAADDRVTLNLYDWRDRLIATKQGALLSSGNPNPSGETDSAHRLITYTTYDNLGEATSSSTYAGDEVNLNDFANWTSSTDSSDLRAYSTQSYDAQGRVYLAETYSVDPTSGTVGSSLATNYYYDLNGNLIEEADPGGVVTKHAYDGANRDIEDSTTDGGAINNGGTPLTDWSDADSTTNDVVIEQTDNCYDHDGNLIKTEDQQRFDNDSTSSTGPLGGPSSGVYSRNYYMAYYYDAAGRQTDSVDVGTNGGSAWTRPSSVPSDSATVLVTHTDYDAAGNPSVVTDPRGIETKTEYDMLGRTIETIAAWDGTDDAVPTNDTNQTTTYTYDGDNNTLTMTAVMPSGTNSQTTAYIYNDTGGTIGTNLFCDDLLVKIEYPSASTGDASTTSTDDQSYTYDNLGEQATFTDQNGTTHTYGYDVLGRLTSDTATTLGSGVSGGTRRLGYSFNDAGLPFKQTSYYNTSGTSVENQVEDLYNGYGQLITQYQAVAGSVNTSTTPKVQYGYSQPSGTNYSRQSSLTYPNGRVVDYNYNTGIDTTISRLSSMSDSGGNIESYSYLGLSTIVREVRPGSVLTLVKANGASNGDAGDMYTGLDRFGRVVDQLWTTADTLSSGTGGDTLGTTTDQFEYGYDQDGNVLYEENMVHGADSELYHANSTTSGDDSSAYDPLNRLTAFRRGTLSSSGNNGSTLDTVTTASATNSWDYDALGNSTETGSTSRGFNSKNQITSYGGSSTITYDHDGNMTTDQAGNTYTYDAWNRLVEAVVSGNNEEYTYDAGGARPGLSVCDGATTTSYYSTQWQDLEDDVTVSGECGPTTTTSTYLWSEAYIDELVARDTGTTRVYAQEDANHDVTSLTNSSGTVLERFVYDPYGARTVLSSSWSSTSDSYSWVYGFQGGRLDPFDGLINFRNRDLNPTTGTWMEQDPAGYVNGADLYQIEIGNPTDYSDPFGLDVDIIRVGGQPVKLPNGGQVPGFGTVNVWTGANEVLRAVPDGNPLSTTPGMFIQFTANKNKKCTCHWLQFITMHEFDNKGNEIVGTPYPIAGGAYGRSGKGNVDSEDPNLPWYEVGKNASAHISADGSVCFFDSPTKDPVIRGAYATWTVQDYLLCIGTDNKYHVTYMIDWEEDQNGKYTAFGGPSTTWQFGNSSTLPGTYKNETDPNPTTYPNPVPPQKQ